MSSKIYQLSLLNKKKEVDSFDGNLEKGVKRLFAERDLLKREIKVLNAKMHILEELAFRMEERLQRVCEAL